MAKKKKLRYDRLAVMALCILLAGAMTVTLVKTAVSFFSSASEQTTEAVTKTFTTYEEDVDAASLEGLDTEALGYGFVPTDRDELNRPNGLAYYNSVYGDYGGVSYINTEDKIVYLTMDEGYENGFTPQILDTLKEKNVKATFFVTGQFYDEHPELIERMIEEGHTVGNHSNNHKDMPSLSLEEQYEEVKYVHNGLVETFGYSPVLFRFPQGKASQQSVALLEEMGYNSVFWSFAYGDYDTSDQPEEEASLDYMLESVHPGAVYLLHAVSETNTNVLADFIDGVREQGYEFGILSDAISQSSLQE